MKKIPGRGGEPGEPGVDGIRGSMDGGLRGTSGIIGPVWSIVK